MSYLEYLLSMILVEAAMDVNGIVTIHRGSLTHFEWVRLHVFVSDMFSAQYMSK